MAQVIVRLPSNISQQIIDELNLARQNPKGYIPILQGASSIRSYSPSEVAETIRFLQSAIPCTNTLVSIPTLERVAQDWVNTQGPTGNLGHGDFSRRISGIGTYKSIAENIQYGFSTARDIVIALIVDQGIPGKGHRINIFNCNFNQIGVAQGYHSKFQVMTSMIFAQGFQPY